MNRTVVLASDNVGKLREINQLLASLEFAVVPQARFQVPAAAETGLTFVENALLKARNAAQHSGHAAIADDSGLEVDALGGAPGVRSARYAGIGASDAANLRKVLTELRDVPDEKRGARFQCVMVYVCTADDPTPIVAHGTWEGRLLFEPVGSNGFGYDPIFFVPGHGCSSAQLAPEIKNRLSHRGQALRQLLTALNNQRPRS
jgi:XTP/dITP diphosphohydrolase